MADFRVTNANDSGAGSLRQAISDSNATNGTDKIVFDNALSGSTINLTSGEIRIADNLTIEGLGDENLTIDAGGKSRIFYLAGDSTNEIVNGIDVVLEGLTITGGFSSADGGAIDGSAISGVRNLTISDSTISRNSASGNGGAIATGSINNLISISGSTISGNSASGDGGAIVTRFGDINISLSTFSGNSAGRNGGGINSSGIVKVDKSNFAGNIAGRSGGGLYSHGMTLWFSNISNNQAAEQGGGVYTFGTTAILNSIINNNKTDGSGGGIHVIGGFFEQNKAVIANTTISGNTAKGNGGGLYISGTLFTDTPNLTNEPGVDFIEEFINFSGDVLASNVTITNNIADSDNTGDENGGGVYAIQPQIIGNLDPTEGVRLRYSTPGKLTLVNSILAGNFDTPNNQGQGTINPDIFGAVRGNANNLVGSLEGLTIQEVFVAPATESLGQGSDIINSNPQLGALQDNGGLTLTHALLTNSPAINAGNNEIILRETFIQEIGFGDDSTADFDNNLDTNDAQLPYDQRGGDFNRIVGGSVDIGAFELQDGENTNPDNTALTLTGGTAQIAYVAYYGRPADKGGLDFWNDGLTNSGVSYSPRGGDPLTGAEEDIYNNIVNQFGNSAEADRLFGAIDSNRDKVNQVYQFAFNRDGDDGGLDFWTEQIDLGNVTLATFALEVALGAQNEDIVVLNNKINSADLFSNGIDTQPETAAYSGSTGEIFGREWLGDFGGVVSSQVQVDEALTNLVNQS